MCKTSRIAPIVNLLHISVLVGPSTSLARSTSLRIAEKRAQGKRAHSTSDNSVVKEGQGEMLTSCGMLGVVASGGYGLVGRGVVRAADVKLVLHLVNDPHDA